MVRNITKGMKVNSRQRAVESDSDLLRHFSLSRNKSLRTLEITAQSIVAAKGTAPDFSSKPYSPPSRLLYPSMLLSSIGTVTLAVSSFVYFVVQDPFVSATTQKLWTRWPVVTNRSSGCSTRCTTYGTSGWCFVRTFLIAWWTMGYGC